MKTRLTALKILKFKDTTAEETIAKLLAKSNELSRRNERLEAENKTLLANQRIARLKAAGMEHELIKDTGDGKW